VEVRDVVRHALDGVAPLLAQRRHRLEAEDPPAGLLVEGDLVRLSQILLNLLLNAAKYTAGGGEIQLTTEAEGGEVRIRIRDTGLGISPQRIDEIFTPFSQGPRPDGGPPSGLGLGLTISRRLAELHGGHLTVRSDWPQKGSEFTLHLPRLAGVQRASPQEPAPGQAEQGVQVLVVDDNPDVAGALALLLEVLGCQTEIAASGDEALALVERRCPRVALVDIGLPGMDGLELARRLRQRFPRLGQLLLVAVTGYGHTEARERSRAAGFDLHLAKPVDLPTLESLLADLDLQGRTD
jgi:CheY-like chemotaxis protein